MNLNSHPIDSGWVGIQSGMIPHLVQNNQNNNQINDSNHNLADIFASKLYVNQTNLKHMWDVAQRTTVEDWDNWMRGWSVELLKESPYPALRACSLLAQKYSPLSRSLWCFFILLD